MAKQGHNSELSKEEMAKVAKLHEDIVALKDKVSALNADANAKRKEIRAMGIDLSAYAAAAKRKAMDPDQRAEFDRSAAILNSALGIPLQADLFGDANANDDNPIPSAA